jgi:hypothetical protein
MWQEVIRIGRVFEIPWIDWPDQAKIEGVLVLNSRLILLW